MPPMLIVQPQLTLVRDNLEIASISSIGSEEKGVLSNIKFLIPAYAAQGASYFSEAAIPSHFMEETTDLSGRLSFGRSKPTTVVVVVDVVVDRPLLTMIAYCKTVLGCFCRAMRSVELTEINAVLGGPIYPAIVEALREVKSNTEVHNYATDFILNSALQERGFSVYSFDIARANCN